MITTALGRQVTDLIQSLNPEFYSAVEPDGNPSETPVFIVGMPRSGTSLVEQIAAEPFTDFGRRRTPGSPQRLRDRVRPWKGAFSGRDGPRSGSQTGGRLCRQASSG